MKRLGLDIGSSSIGWTLREDNEIERWGVITFQSGMVKGQSGGYSSPAKDRREPRSKRRLLQSRKYRKWRLLEILIEEYVPLTKEELNIWSKYKKGQLRKFPENKMFLQWLACDFSYKGGIKYKNPYELRVKALDKKLSKHEMGRALYHLVQRRGYKDIGESDKETEKQIQRRSESGFQKALDENRTIAEALSKAFLDKNLRARNQYPYRDEYERELLCILKKQGFNISQNDKDKYTDGFVDKIRDAIIWQRPLKSQKGNIGKCTLEPTKLRCPVSHPVFEIFRAWSFINTIKYCDEKNEKKNISPEHRKLLFENLFLKKDKNFKFEEIREFLDKQLGSRKKYNYPVDKDGKYDTSVSGMPVCKGLIGIFDKETSKKIKDAIINIDVYNLLNKKTVNTKTKEVLEKVAAKKELNDKSKNDITKTIVKDVAGNIPKIINGYSLYDLWHILFEFDEQHLESFTASKLNLENKKGKFAKLKNSIVSGYADLSLKAMCKIIPFLKEGYLYNEAVVLAKIPELLGEQWQEQKEKIKESILKANKNYEWFKIIVGITNNLIDKYKGLEYPEVYAYKDFEYKIQDRHDAEIKQACIGYFGEKTWEDRKNKDEIFDEVKKLYQDFFLDNKRSYRTVPLLTEIFKNELKKSEIIINGELYHHSNVDNKYLKKCIDAKNGKINLPTYKNTGINILPEPRIDSIKNPMFNKSMSILRKLINELIVSEIIDEETEIVIELARELNDNNKRIAIERYQNERKNKREKYRGFLREFKERENSTLNVEDNISTFEMWTEQTFEQTKDENNKLITNRNNNEILNEKNALKCYELWLEQQGQCIYTGKMITITQLLNSNEIDIEHTIPRSILPDNTLANQTICFARYNREVKKKRMPSELDKNDYSAILSRLNNWITKRDFYKKLYDERIKPKGNEDEEKKNKRIQEKHYYKMHYDYWHDKVKRFEANEVNDSWARRQLVDTQMVSKYAREFLKTYFKKVAVQKGSVTADFRKIYSFQEEDEIKNRNKHTHHAIDAAVLTLIPVNSSYRDKILKQMYEVYEKQRKQFTISPFPGFNSQTLIQSIENNTLIVNYEKDNILKQTFKNLRKRGRLQYLKDKNGEFIRDNKDEKILIKLKGDSVRSILYKDTFVGKIKDVERYEDEQPKRENGDWKYKKGKDEFLYVKREDIKKALSNIDAIVDPVIKELVRNQRNNPVIKDYQGNTIRHVRIKTSVGQKVKERVNYRSNLEHKNYYYSAAGSVPYAILLQKVINGIVEREMIPLASFEVIKMHKKGGFNIPKFIEENYPAYVEWDKKLLKVGQKVIVLNNDGEFEKRKDPDFQSKRLYVITQFSEGNIWLKYHLEAQGKDEIKYTISRVKDNMLRKHEISLNIPEVIEDASIQDNKIRKEDYETRRYRFDTINNSFRLKRISEIIGLDKTKEIKNELDKFKAISAKIEVDGKAPLLKMSKENWNFLFEGTDFRISILGRMEFTL